MNEFTTELHKKRWKAKDLAIRWGVHPTTISAIGRNPKKKDWDALNGLPISDKNYLRLDSEKEDSSYDCEHSYANLKFIMWPFMAIKCLDCNVEIGRYKTQKEFVFAKINILEKCIKTIRDEIEQEKISFPDFFTEEDNE